MLSVVFAVPGTGGLTAAVDALARFYAPLGHAATETRVVPGGAVGWIAFDAAEHRRLVQEASERRLRWEEATFDWRAGPLKTTTEGLVTALYRCDEVVATHAVAAAWLARHRRPWVRKDLVPELVLHEFVLGFETLVEGVAPVQAAMTWPEIPERDAPAAALEALLRTLGQRLAGRDAPALGLTGGLDSHVVAAALAHLGIPAGSFTWSHHEADASGAAAVATRLGLAHERCPPDFLDDADGLAQLRADVRWSEGAARLTPFGRVSWPRRMDAFVTGGGGEIGRAFYYRLEAANHRRPDPARLVSLTRVADRLPNAPGEVVQELEHRLAAELRQLPGEGWRRLDVFYAQRRVARWGRAMLPRIAAPTVPAFAAPEVAAALVAMSERDRTSDGFHRHALRVLARHELPPAPGQRRGVPRPLRRALSAARRWRAAGAVAPPVRWAYAEELERRPLYREWLDEAIGVALPGAWADALRAGVRAGHDAPVMTALLATAPVALEEALRDLPERL